jgi:hypothetical protein
MRIRLGSRVFAIVLGILLSALMYVDSSAQWGGYQRGAGTLPVSAGSTSPVTYTNTARNFSFTIPAGWEIVSGDPNSDDVVFRKSGASWGFGIHMTQMLPSFPRKAAVDAGLKQDKERIKINQVLEARRRDEGSPKKKCGLIGWEFTEAPQTNGIERIIWQGYDRDNYYINLMAYSSTQDFNAARSTLREIMDSIKFCG